MVIFHFALAGLEELTYPTAHQSEWNRDRCKVGKSSQRAAISYRNFIQVDTIHTVHGCEILQLIGGKHFIIGFEPSFWWCRISQPSTVWVFEDISQSQVDDIFFWGEFGPVPSNFCLILSNQRWRWMYWIGMICNRKNGAPIHWFMISFSSVARFGFLGSYFQRKIYDICTYMKNTWI